MSKDPLKISGMHNGASSKVFQNAAELRERMTESESKLWEYLKKKPMGFKFRRQHPLAGYVLDFYWHKLRLSIELDGGYHLKKEQIQRDKERTNYLNEVGILEFRYTNSQVIEEFDAVIRHINHKLCEASL
jgi:very-short-patch-repair endonuclease